MRYLLFQGAPAPTIGPFNFVATPGGGTFATGTGLVQGMTVSVNISGTPIALTNVVVANGGTDVTATLPTAGGPYAAGNWDVTVTNPDGQKVTLVAGFTVFTPSTIAGLMYDLDANADVTQSSGLVTAWLDQSSNAYNFTASGANRPTFVSGAVGGYPVIAGDGASAWMLGPNITHGTKSVTTFVVMKVPVSTDGAVLFEQTNNSKSAAVQGYRVQYKTGTYGPQLDVSSGTTSGSSLNEVYAVTGVALNNGFTAYCFVWDRAATYPVTIIAGTPVYEQTMIKTAVAGQGYITAGSSSSNYDTAPLSLFARNVSGAASVPSKVQIARMFTYNTALSLTTRQNVLNALASLYGTDPSPATCQAIVPGSSLDSVYDTISSPSWTTFFYATDYYDNIQFDVSAVSGWTLSNANTNRVALLGTRRSDVPVYLIIASLGTNDFATNDTLSPGALYATFASFCDYAAGLTSPAFAGILAFPMAPRGNVSAGTAASQEAKRSGKDTSGAALPGYQNAHAYSSATPDWILVSDGSHNQLFRCTTSGTSATASPTWDFTLGNTTSAGGGVVFTCYGRPYNDAMTDAANQVAHKYTALTAFLGTPLDVYANTSVLTYYQADTIHFQPTYQTGQADPANPSGPPFANSIASFLTPFLDQGGTFPRAYLPPVIDAIAPASSAVGSPVTITGREFGEMDTTHPLKIGGLDCTNVVRISDVKLTAVAPAGLALGGPYDVTYLRSDGQTVTLAGAFTAVASAVTAVTVGSLPSVAAETLPAHVLNTFAVSITVSNGGGYGATAAAFNGVSLTSVAYSADGNTVTGTLPTGTNSNGTGNVTVTSTSSPSALVNGAIFATVDPTTTYTTTALRGFGDQSSIQGTGTSTGWNDLGTQANNFTATASPVINTTSAVFSQGGTGIKTVTLDGSTQLFAKTGFVANTVDGTPLQLCVIVKLTSISVSNVGFFYYPGAGGTFELLVPNSTYKPSAEPAPVQATWGTSIQNVACLVAGHCNGQTATTCGISVNGGTEVTASGTMTGSGLKKTGNIQLGKDGSGFMAGEIAAWWVTNVEPTATQRRLDAIYAHNYSNVTI